METVVKEMSHLFQFFPDEVQPLKYPAPIDTADNLGNCSSNRFISFCYHEYWLSSYFEFYE